jgi:Zn-dependent protease
MARMATSHRAAGGIARAMGKVSRPFDGVSGVNYFSGGLPAAWGALVFVVLLFLCVLLHEFGHIFAARAFGVSTLDVILLPIGGVSRLERIPEKPSEEFLVAIAGPAVNVVIAVLLILFAGAKLGMDSLVSIENTSAGFIDRLAEVNLFLALFNLIPAFPMDGGRVLRALLATRFGYVRATEIAGAIGQWVAFALGFLGLFGPARHAPWRAWPRDAPPRRRRGR